MLEPETCIGKGEVAPEAQLIAAVLHRVLQDIRHPSPSLIRTSSAPTLADQLASLEWLLDASKVASLSEMIGLDGRYMQQQILTAAGLGPADATPRLGARRGPSPD